MKVINIYLTLFDGCVQATLPLVVTHSVLNVVHYTLNTCSWWRPWIPRWWVEGPTVVGAEKGKKFEEIHDLRSENVSLSNKEQD